MTVPLSRCRLKRVLRPTSRSNGSQDFVRRLDDHDLNEAFLLPCRHVASCCEDDKRNRRNGHSSDWQLCANSGPSAWATQPRQFGWQATQLNFIRNLRSSSAMPACVEPPSTATRPDDAMQRGGGAEQHPSSGCRPTNASRG